MVHEQIANSARLTMGTAAAMVLLAGAVVGCTGETRTASDERAAGDPDSSIASLAGDRPTPPARAAGTTRTASEPTTAPETQADAADTAVADPATLARVRESAALLDEYFASLKPGTSGEIATDEPGAAADVRISRSGGYDPSAVRGPTRVVSGVDEDIPAPTASIADASPTRTTPARTTPARDSGSGNGFTPAVDTGTVAAGDDTDNPADGGTLESGPSMVARPVSPEERKAAVVEELVALLRELGQSPDQRYQAALALAGLEVLAPDAMYELVDEGVMLPSETAVLVGAHKLFSELAAGGEIVDPGGAMDVLDEVGDELNAFAPIKITSAELCTRVMGFGQFDTFGKDADGGYTFIAGRRQPVIIYVEVDRFGRKPTVGADGIARWEVALSQELQIYHAEDELLVMSRSAETDRTLTRSRMRDYYLINQTFLPETLGVGRYMLKVIMRDENKEAVAEALIPIRMVSNRSTASVPITTE